MSAIRSTLHPKSRNVRADTLAVVVILSLVRIIFARRAVVKTSIQSFNANKTLRVLSARSFRGGNSPLRTAP